MNLLDVAGIAAYVIYNKQNPTIYANTKESRRIFLRATAEGLMQPQIYRRETLRLNSRAKLSRETLRIELSSVSTSKKRKVERKHTSTVKRRCHMCESKADRKQRQVCDICQKNVCGEHSTVIRTCQKCKNEL